MAFRMSPSTQSTGYSPYYMLFGKEMPLPINVALWPNELLDKAPKDYIEDLIKKVKIIQEIAQEHVSKAQTESKTRYDKKAKIPQYKIRDQVLLKVM